MARVSRNAQSDIPTYEDIARKAYELYIQRGGEPGRDVDDWLEAERLLVTVDVIEEVVGTAEPVVVANGTTPKPAARRARAAKPATAKNGTNGSAEPKLVRRAAPRQRSTGKN